MRQISLSSSKVYLKIAKFFLNPIIHEKLLTQIELALVWINFLGYIFIVIKI